jgi:2,5-dihydroxypyridine 5,6-dioxygenase
MNPSYFAASPISYLETPTASPMGIVDMMPGVKNLLDYASVSAGEKLLLLTEHATDPVVLQAIAAGAAYRGANVNILSIEPFSPGGHDTGYPGDEAIAEAAHARADVVITCTYWSDVHCEPFFFSQVAIKGVRFVSLHMAALGAVLATGARLAPEVYYVLQRKSAEILGGGADVRVTTPGGTDLVFSDIELTPDDGPLAPGSWRPFPYGGVNFYPGNTNGIFQVEDSTATGIPAEPTFVVLKDNKVVEIQGGAAAEELRRFSPNGYYMRHALMGVNPKVRLMNGTQFEREKHSGAFYLGIDALTSEGEIDSAGPGFAHCDCQFDYPTITVGDTVLSDGGRLTLLDDPEVREVAAKYGPPDVLLDDNARMQIPRRYSGYPLAQANRAE